MSQVHVLAGLSWNPAIRGILVVAVAVAILLGSIYLIIGTNTGARLGLLLSLGSLFGWLSILTLYWWISPPGIGPKGADPSWKSLEVYIHEPERAQGPAKIEVMNLLPEPSVLPTAEQIIDANPSIADQFVVKPEQATLGDVADVNKALPDGSVIKGTDILKNGYGITVVNAETPDSANKDALNGWKVLGTSQAGDAQAAADIALVESGKFKDSTEYRKLNAYDIGGNPRRKEECADSDLVCRTIFRAQKTFRIFHPPHYVVVQVQPVLHQVAKPGEAPPVPTVDPTQPVVSVVLVRDQGNLRAKPAYFFAICFSLFLVFALMLHYRDKTLQEHLVEAEKAKKENRDKTPVKAGV